MGSMGLMVVFSCILGSVQVADRIGSTNSDVSDVFLREKHGKTQVSSFCYPPLVEHGEHPGGLQRAMTQILFPGRFESSGQETLLSGENIVDPTVGT